MGLLREGVQREVRVIPKHLGNGKAPILIQNPSGGSKLVRSAEILGPSKLVVEGMSCSLKTQAAIRYET